MRTSTAVSPVMQEVWAAWQSHSPAAPRGACGPGSAGHRLPALGGTHCWALAPAAAGGARPAAAAAPEAGEHEVQKQPWHSQLRREPAGEQLWISAALRHGASPAHGSTDTDRRTLPPPPPIQLMCHQQHGVLSSVLLGWSWDAVPHTGLRQPYRGRSEECCH